MSTLPIRVPHVPQVWPFPDFARIVSVITMVIDAFTEAQEQAHATRKRRLVASLAVATIIGSVSSELSCHPECNNLI
jgi:hypothetical protein